MAILSLLARLGINKSGFDAGMAQATKTVQKFGSDVKTQLAGAFTLAAATLATREIIRFADASIKTAEAVGDLAQRLNMTTDDAQAFALAARTGGTNVDYFASKIEKLRDFMAKGGSLAEFGIKTGNLTEIISKFGELANSGMSDSQLVKFVEVFGKGSGKMVNVFGDLAKAKEAIRFSREDVAASQEFSDTFVRMANAAKVFAVKGMRNFGFLGFFGGDERADKSDQRRMRIEEIQAREAASDTEEDTRLAHMAIQERIATMDRETIEINERARQSALSDEERLLELKREQVILMANLATETKDDSGLFQEGYYMMQKRLAEVSESRAGLERKGAGQSLRTILSPGRGSIESDQFQRIGAFTGQAGQAAQTESLRKIDGNIARILEMQRQGLLVRTND